ncbi:hypothetical protein [Erinnyis ello granulovirus]|uniref:Uncharacterized protein n=1 Tax=Erinnyis ello granulovirus TaxID=307444 RepID=A0A097DAQ1_9BBAC|nr:hypothetical protein [Erinnyis ello granulovirus]AIS92099.1 hypothetical protein [Erinnyis ello granulovirus]ARX71570.1 hypothetical protein EREL_101 [Erinnyis ello granulovirus]ARX71700.1 hypothetical protein EREL_101 [Erinnyis ello granulovirus]ARX71830.1 hypothetical protein EREL_101 [Erinnyis ello granulovirus]ARX71960.1 hypothetical protein EREL_101 [Erinnyis ello granulovirus]
MSLLTQVMLDCLKSGICPNLMCTNSTACGVNHRSFYGDLVTFDDTNQPNNIVKVHDLVVVTNDGCWITYTLQCGTTQKSRLCRHCVAYKQLHLRLQSHLLQLSNEEVYDVCRYIMCTICMENNNYKAYRMSVRETKLTLFVDAFPSWRHFQHCSCCIPLVHCSKLVYTYNNVFAATTIQKCLCKYCKYEQQPMSLFDLSLRAASKYKLGVAQLFEDYALPLSIGI